MNFTFGFYAVCVGLGILIALAIFKNTNRNNKVKTDYDERQAAIRGKGYKYAFFTACGLLVLSAVADMSDVNLPLTAGLIELSIIFISGLVLSSYCLWNDAYFGTNSNVKKFALVFLVIAIINALVSAQFYKEGLVVVDGIVTEKFINVECTIVFAVIGIQYLIKSALSKNSQEEDEE